jgi:hypothetical protein
MVADGPTAGVRFGENYCRGGSMDSEKPLQVADFLGRLRIRGIFVFGGAFCLLKSGEFKEQRQIGRDKYEGAIAIRIARRRFVADGRDAGCD